MAEHQAGVVDRWDANPQYVSVEDEPATHDVQAGSENVSIDYDTIEFFGQKFRLAERIGIMPMIAFANASKNGLDTDDMDGLAAMYRLIRSVIHRPPLYDDHGQRVVDENGKTLRDESEWLRFEQVAEDELAEGEDVMEFVNKAMEVMSARPRKRRSVSAATSPQTSERSRVGSSSPGNPALPDLTPVGDL